MDLRKWYFIVTWQEGLASDGPWLLLRLHFLLWHSGLRGQLDHKRAQCGENLTARDKCGKMHTELKGTYLRSQSSYTVIMYSRIQGQSWHHSVPRASQGARQTVSIHGVNGGRQSTNQGGRGHREWGGASCSPGQALCAGSPP